LGLAALLAAGLPVFFLLVPLGGVSPLEMLSVHALLLAHLLVVGGLCVGFAAALGRTLPVMLSTCGAVLLWNGGPALGRIWGHGRSWGWLWDAWQSHSTRGWLDRQLASIGLVPALVGEAAAFGLLAALLFSGLGSLVLERRMARGPARGFWRTLAAALRKAAASRRAGFLFRPFLRIEHPLLRRECGVERDLPFRAAWLGLFAVYGLSVAAVLAGHENHVLAHLALGGFGWMTASVIAILLGASSIGADRRRGALEALLAAGVAPEDLVKACLAGSLLRAGYLLAPPVLHLMVVGVVAGELGPAELAWRLPASLAGVFLGTLAMMGITLYLSLAVRRAEVASVLAAIWALPIGLVIMAMVGGSILSFVMGLPIIVLGMLVYYAALVRSVPKMVLR
ncbi:MAG TPA: hypothetical protein VMU54_07725, partial [Planctomycetota bacterium]|nr:hypothetical protein [Planctomycetota bacterium]